MSVYKDGNLRNSANTLTKFKNLIKNDWANSKQTWHKASLGEEDSRFLQI